MALNALVERFSQRSPVTVMVRRTLEHALNSQWIDEVFEAQRDKQYTRELLFSSVVDLMGLANSGAGGPAQGGIGADSEVGGEAGTQLAQFQSAALERWARSQARQEADDGKEARRTGRAQRTPEAIAARREGRLPGADIPRGVQPLHGGGW